MNILTLNFCIGAKDYAKNKSFNRKGNEFRGSD